MRLASLKREIMTQATSHTQHDQTSQTRNSDQTMMNHPTFGFDPRILAAASAQASRQRRRGSVEEAQEVASFLLQLKHRSAPELPLSGIHDEAERRILLQQAAQAAHLRAAAVSAAYPTMGAVYGLPDFTKAVIERPPSLLEEPSVTDISWDALLGDSKLVSMKDRDLVPDALFVAMAQMKPCKLTQADRVGCYKSREIGFTGMACKHCGGQPGFGRYYPNSVRSLAQTTTSQTILKHIGSKCRFCPTHIRQAVLELQRQQAAKEGIATGRPRYGSRKIFFQRMWARLHGKETSEFETDDEDSKAETPASSAHATPSNSDEEQSDSDVEHDNGSRRSPGQKRKVEAGGPGLEGTKRTRM